MTDLFRLSIVSLAHKPLLSLSHFIPRVDDRRVVGGIIFVIKNGLR